jgi:hypothetical protein
MERPDIAQTMREAKAMLKDIDAALAKSQELATRARFAVSMAVEMNAAGGSATFDHIIKSQVYTEAMGQLFSRIIEARTHLDVAVRALELGPKVTNG